MPDAGEAVLLLRLHALELVAALDEVAELLARRVEGRVRGRLALGPELRQRPRVQPVGLGAVERAGEVPGVQRVEAPAGLPGLVERPAQRVVAAAGGLVEDEVGGVEPGDPAGDGRGFVGDPRLSAARVADVEGVLRDRRRSSSMA